MMRAARDADDRAVDVPGAVELRLRIVDGHRRRAVRKARLLVLDERDAPLAVEVHRDLACLECLRRGELVTEPGLEANQLLVAVPVHEALLPLRPLRPRGVLREDRVALGVDELAAVRLD